MRCWDIWRCWWPIKKHVPVESVAINGWDASGTKTFEAQSGSYYASFSISVNPSNATNKMVTITSSNPSVINRATYDSSDVTFTIEWEWTAEVTITSQDNAEISTTYSVEVTPAPEPFQPNNSILVMPGWNTKSRASNTSAIVRFFATDENSTDYVQARFWADNKLTYISYHWACEWNEYCETMFSDESIKEELWAKVWDYIDTYWIPEWWVLEFSTEVWTSIENYFSWEGTIEDVVETVEEEEVVPTPTISWATAPSGWVAQGGLPYHMTAAFSVSPAWTVVSAYATDWVNTETLTVSWTTISWDLCEWDWDITVELDSDSSIYVTSSISVTWTCQCPSFTTPSTVASLEVWQTTTVNVSISDWPFTTVSASANTAWVSATVTSVTSNQATVSITWVSASSDQSITVSWEWPNSCSDSVTINITEVVNPQPAYTAWIYTDRSTDNITSETLTQKWGTSDLVYVNWEYIYPIVGNEYTFDTVFIDPGGCWDGYWPGSATIVFWWQGTYTRLNNFDWESETYNFNWDTSYSIGGWETSLTVSAWENDYIEFSDWMPCVDQCEVDPCSSADCPDYDECWCTWNCCETDPCSSPDCPGYDPCECDGDCGEEPVEDGEEIL